MADKVTEACARMDAITPDTGSCGCLQYLHSQGYEFPFTQTISFSFKTMNMLTTPWTVLLQKKTPTGRKSSRDSKILLLNFCPICGQKIDRKEDETDEANQTVTGDEIYDGKM